MMKRTGWGFFLSVLFLILGIVNVSAANVVLDIPPNIIGGQMFDVNVIIDPEGEHIAGVQLDLEYNPSSILINSITEGNFLKQSGINTFFNKGTIDNSIGKAVNIYGAILGIGNVTTPGTFIIISATSIQSINSKDITLTNVLMVNPEGGQVYPIPTPKPTDQTQAVSSASGDAPPGGTGSQGASGEAAAAGSNKTLLVAAFAGVIIILILVYKYVVPKYLASKDHEPIKIKKISKKKKGTDKNIGKPES
jgi:hypothetical protein